LDDSLSADGSWVGQLTMANFFNENNPRL